MNPLLSKIIILLVFIYLIYYIKKLAHSYSNKTYKVTYIQNYFRKYSQMVHLSNDTNSIIRLNNCKKYWKNNIFPTIANALHWGKDKHIINQYPIDKKLLDRRPGAYGLAGSLYRNLIKAYINNWDYMMHIEDDCVPNKNLSNKQFIDLFYNSLISLPDGEGLYSYSLTVYCKPSFTLTKKPTLTWKKYASKVYTAGTTCILFTKKAIEKIIRSNIKIYEIDNYLKDMFTKNKHFYFYDGPLSKNKMFYGLFEQYNTNCAFRTNNIISRK